MKHLPIAQTEFKTIIEDDFCYVDKTMFIKQLLDDRHKYYFLSRPRRFGKSLFLDTLKEAFSANKKLFKGLYLENNWDWNTKYPVIKISFGSTDAHSKEELEIRLFEIINSNSEDNGVELKYKSAEGQFQELIKRLFEKYNQPVVVLIDEYDKPILDNPTWTSHNQTGIFSIFEG